MIKPLKYFFVFAFTGMNFFLSCNKIPTFPTNNNPKSFSEVFDEYWNGMNRNYLYWDIDTTNWDHIYNTYKPIFSQLDLNNADDVKKSVGYFKEMTCGLTDAHYYISFTRHEIADSSIYPAYDKKKNNSDFHDPFPYWRVDSNYLDKNYQLGFDNTNSINGDPLTVLYGTIQNKILYFYCNNFSLSKSYHASSTNDIQPILKSFFNNLNNLPANIHGLIIDVRSNYGGNLSDLNFLVGKLISKPLHFGYTQYKSGNGRLDYTPWIKAIIDPGTDSKEITIPIIVLADNASASLSEAIVMAIDALPNGTFIGETTFGATGPLTDFNAFNDGSFVVPDFLNVQTSSGKFKYLNGRIYEGKGFPPDIFIPFNKGALQNDKDFQLEKAINLIH